MIFQIENKNVHASDAGQGIDSKKDTVIFLHGSGLSHIVWSLSEQFLLAQRAEMPFPILAGVLGIALTIR